MSPWLLLLLGSTFLLYLLVVLPLSRDEVPIGKLVVVAPTLTATIDGKRKRVDALVRRWERGWNGTKGEQRVVPDAEGRCVFPAVTVRSWAARVVPHKPFTELSLHVARGAELEEVWVLPYTTYDDQPAEIRVRL